MCGVVTHRGAGHATSHPWGSPRAIPGARRSGAAMRHHAQLPSARLRSHAHMCARRDRSCAAVLQHSGHSPEAQTQVCRAGPSCAMDGARRATTDGSSESRTAHLRLRRGSSVPPPPRAAPSAPLVRRLALLHESGGAFLCVLGLKHRAGDFRFDLQRLTLRHAQARPRRFADRLDGDRAVGGDLLGDLHAPSPSPDRPARRSSGSRCLSLPAR